MAPRQTDQVYERAELSDEMRRMWFSVETDEKPTTKTRIAAIEQKVNDHESILNKIWRAFNGIVK